MAKITREQIAGLQLEDGLKAELLSLFDGIISSEEKIKNLQSKVPEDSQTIVAKTDFEAFKNAQKELAEYKQKLAEKLAQEQKTPEGETFFPFTNLFKIFE